MPRLGSIIAALAVCVTACDQQVPVASESAAAPAQFQPAPATAPSRLPPGFTGAPYAASRTYFKLQGRYPTAWFLCDGIDKPRAVIVGLPDAAGDLSIMTLDKQTLTRSATSGLRLGEPDPGAGNVYWPLTRGGGEAGSLRAFNPGMIEEPRSATTATFSSVTLAQEAVSCRWTPNIKVQALGARRSYLVTLEDGQLVYRSFDYADAATARLAQTPDAGRTTTPSLEIHGGGEIVTPQGRRFVFDKADYRYSVEIGTVVEPHGALLVTRAGRPIASEPFEAYVDAVPR